MAAIATALVSMFTIPTTNVTSANSIGVTTGAMQAVNVLQSYMLFGRLQSGWRLRRPLVINLETDDKGCFIASDDLFLLYGQGKSLQAAIEDYVTGLLEYNELLTVRIDQGDAELDAIYSRLTAMLVHS